MTAHYKIRLKTDRPFIQTNYSLLECAFASWMWIWRYYMYLCQYKCTPIFVKSGLLPVNRTVIKRPTAESLKITLTGIVFQMVSVLFLIEFVHGYKNVYIHQLIRVLLRMPLALLYGYILI